MKNFRTLSLLLLAVIFLSCEKEAEKTYEGAQEAHLFAKPSSTFEVINGQASSIDVVVGNIKTSSVDRVIPISVSPTSTATASQYTLSSPTVTIPAGQSTGKFIVSSANFNALPLSGAVDLVLLIGAGNGYVLPSGNRHVVSIERGCTNTKVDLNITFDPYASEISWVLRNSSNAVIAQSAAYADGLGSFRQRLCLTPGTYTFTMNDSYGDGIAPGNFNLKLTSAPAGTFLVSGSVFGFTTGPLSFNIQ